MRSNKRYTNTAFTKRIGKASHYHPTRSGAEPAICEACDAVYVDRRWTSADAVHENGKHKHWHPAYSIICPACRQQREGIAGGYVHLDGAFWVTHQQQIEQLLRNEAARAAINNPLTRIMGWERSRPGQLALKTTTERLAQRLGHALEKSFGGTVRYGFSHENKLTHVWWRRD